MGAAWQGEETEVSLGMRRDKMVRKSQSLTRLVELAMGNGES